MLKCNFFLRGCPSIKVLTDHRPLVGLFDKQLDEMVNPRLLRLREKLVNYSLLVEWVPGKTHLIADALSRAPVFSADAGDNLSIDTFETPAKCFAATGDPALHILLDAIDSTYTSQVNFYKSGSNPKDLPVTHPARLLLSVWPRLSITTHGENELLTVDGRRVFPPATCRPKLLAALHRSHPGVTKMYELARQYYYWPGLHNDVKQMVADCTACHSHLPGQPNQPAPVQLPSDAIRPMTHVGTDLFQLGAQHWLLLVDRFSGYAWPWQLRSLTTSAVVAKLTACFNEHGWPEAIRSDGGPQFRSEFADFCKNHQIRHELASANNPQSNGLAEAAVKNIKYLLSKCRDLKEDFPSALYAWRCTPRADGHSPFALFYSRVVRRPDLPGLPPQPVHIPLAGSRRDEFASRRVPHGDVPSPQLPVLHIGQNVLFQDDNGSWNKRGVIIKIRTGGFSFEVKQGNKVYVRSRRFLRPRPADATSASAISQSGHLGLPSSSRSPLVQPATSPPLTSTQSPSSTSWSALQPFGLNKSLYSLHFPPLQSSTTTFSH